MRLERYLGPALMLVICLSVLGSAQAATGASKQKKPSISELTARASKGDAAAEAALGQRYQSGDGVTQSFDQAAGFYRQAAAQGDRDGEFALGNLYQYGLGVTQDFTQASQWYEKAAARGSVEAADAVARMYLLGDGIPKDLPKAAHWYRIAAEKGDDYASLALGGMYFSGQGVTQDYAEAVRWYRRVADRGSALGERTLASMYLAGDGVPKDRKIALHWYTKAAQQEDPASQVEIAKVYLFAKDSPPDYVAAQHWLMKAAGHGDTDAEEMLGWMYGEGKGVTQDAAQAAMWYQKAADSGDPFAEYMLAGLYHYGKGVPIDQAKSATLLQAAAAAGQADAEYTLATFYFNGEGLPKDEAAARAWFAKALAQGQPLAVCGQAEDTLSRAPTDVSRAAAVAALEADARKGVFMCMNDLAWYRASTPGMSAQDLAEADSMMQKSLQNTPADAALLDTMAAVQAAEGHYDVAAADEEKAITAVPDQPDLQKELEGFKTRLALYQSGKPYVSPPPAATAVKAVPMDFDAVQARAQQGDPDAEGKLGFKYEYGEGVTRDHEQAMIWLEKAAESGNYAVARNLGIRCQGGVPSGCGDAQAFHWFSLAAKGGDTHSQIQIAIMYEHGLGVAQDHARAEDMMDTVESEDGGGAKAYDEALTDLLLDAFTVSAAEQRRMRQFSPAPLIIQFRYDAGHATDVQVIQSSGRKSLDDEAVAGLLHLTLPPLPRDLDPTSLFSVGLHFVFPK